MPVTPSGVPGFDDTFFGPKDKAYMDRLARDLVKVRGINVLYYKKRDVPARIDGVTPLSNNPNASPFDPKGRKGTAVAGLYGEPVALGPRIDSTKRELSPAWDYADPIELRGVAFNTERSDNADDRGHIEVLKIQFHLARAMCDDVTVTPEPGDVIQFPTLLGACYDTERVNVDSHRFGGTGFFTAYELSLVRSSKFVPPRKDLPRGQAK